MPGIPTCTEPLGGFTTYLTRTAKNTTPLAIFYKVFVLGLNAIPADVTLDTKRTRLKRRYRGHIHMAGSIHKLLDATSEDTRCLDKRGPGRRPFHGQPAFVHTQLSLEQVSLLRSRQVANECCECHVELSLYGLHQAYLSRDTGDMLIHAILAQPVAAGFCRPEQDFVSSVRVQVDGLFEAPNEKQELLSETR